LLFELLATGQQPGRTACFQLALKAAYRPSATIRCASNRTWR